MSASASPKKVHVIAAGMRHVPTQAALQSWLESLHELGIVARTSTSVVGHGHEGDTGIAVINELMNEIAAHYDAVDGVVVLHGLDDVVMTATAATYSLSNVTKPVVVTVGGPPSAAVAELSTVTQQANLINAVHVATLPIPEVCLVFGSRLLRASAAVRSQTAAGAVSFDAAEAGVLGRIDFSIRLNHRRIRPPAKGKLQVLPLAQRVVTVRLTPWVTAEWLMQQLAEADALLLDARPANSLPAWVTAFLQTQPLPCVVAVLADPPAGTIDRREVVLLAHAKPQLALAKLAWAAAAAKTPREAATLLGRPLAGEPEL